MYRIFLSHDHRDKAIAKIFARTLSRITLGQLDVWFSSDPSSLGGIQPGVWLAQIREHLAESRAVIPLLTPSSIVRPWLLFETGFGASRAECEVIPIAVGINSLSDIPFPLAMYQVFGVTGYDSFRDVVARILHLYDIKFDEEMAASILKKAISEIVQQLFDGEDKSNDSEQQSNELLEDIKTHMDKHFFQFERLFIKTVLQEESLTQQLQYSVPVKLSFPNLKSTQYINISEKTSVGDVLNDMYCILASEVEAYKYLQTWMMRDIKHKRNLIVREVADCIPAKYIFTSDSEWEVIPLVRPYSGSDSDDYKRWL